MVNEIKNGYKEIEILTANLEKKSKEYCKDISISLDDRWKLFDELGLGDNDSCYLSFEDLGIDIYSGMGYDIHKYENVDLVYKANSYQDLVNTEESKVDSWQKKQWNTLHENGGQEFVDKMKERCISNWTKSCDFDW